MEPREFIDKVFAESGVLMSPRIFPYGHSISRYLTVGIDHVTSLDTNTVFLLPELVQLFDVAREIMDRAIPVRAGFRTHDHEQTLQARGYRTAKFVSPHSVCAALDCDAIGRPERPEVLINVDLQKAFKAAAERLQLPRPRLGHRAYNETFTHVDLVFLLFQPHTKLVHPETWPELSDSQRAGFMAWHPGIEW